MNNTKKGFTRCKNQIIILQLYIFISRVLKLEITTFSFYTLILYKIKDIYFYFFRLKSILKSKIYCSTIIKEIAITNSFQKIISNVIFCLIKKKNALNWFFYGLRLSHIVSPFLIATQTISLCSGHLWLPKKLSKTFSNANQSSYSVQSLSLQILCHSSWIGFGGLATIPSFIFASDQFHTFYTQILNTVTPFVEGFNTLFDLNYIMKRRFFFQGWLHVFDHRFKLILKSSLYLLRSHK